MALGTKLGVIASSGVSAFENVYSIDFDGVDDYLAGGSAFTALNGLTKGSFSVWVKPISGTPALRFICQIGVGSTSLTSQVNFYLYEGVRIDFSVDTSSYFGRGNIGAITYGSWNHILITVDFAGSTDFHCYVNGADETTSDNMTSRTAFPNATDELYLGESKTGVYNPFKGNIDEFAIWAGTALTATDAVNIYNSGVPTNLSSFSTPPTHWWRNGDGDTYPTITDHIGSYNITMTNMVSGDIETDVPS